jgi:hypothetical protein
VGPPTEYKSVPNLGYYITGQGLTKRQPNLVIQFPIPAKKTVFLYSLNPKLTSFNFKGELSSSAKLPTWQIFP